MAQSLLFAAGLRPTPAQATAVSWVRDEIYYNDIFMLDSVRHFMLCLNALQIIKDGMQHAGKLICSNMGARMDSEPKSWRILGW